MTNDATSSFAMTASGWRDRATGTEALRNHVPVPEFIAVTEPDVRRQFASLKNEDQRHAYLDALMGRLDASVISWTTFYEAVSIIRDHRPYWRKQGYSNFAEFWQLRAGPTFEAWRELEDIYAFAKLACPQLFELDTQRARRLSDRLNTLSAPTSRKRLHVQGSKRVFETPAAATEAIRNALNWTMVGNRSFEYRLYRLKRDRPAIAASLLSGEFTVRLDSGKYSIDLIRAERLVYGDDYRLHGGNAGKPKNGPGKRMQSHASDAKKVLRELDHVADVAKHSPDIQQQIVRRLQKLPWLVEAIAQSTRAQNSQPK
jgi:hypothetical protein